MNNVIFLFVSLLALMHQVTYLNSKYSDLYCSRIKYVCNDLN